MENTITLRYFGIKNNCHCTALPHDVLNYQDLTFCLSGNLRYEINDKPCILSPGDLIYFAPGDTRRRFSSEKMVSYVSINFFAETKQIPEGYYFPQILSQKVNVIFDLFNSAYTKHHTPQCLALLDYILLEINSIIEAKNENPHIVKIKNFINQNLENKITIDDIAKYLYLSKIYCEAFFKKETGQTLIQYINEEKIKNAQNLLLQGDLSLTEIATKLSFSDYNYFARTFKKIVGMTPSQYINLNR